MGLTNEDIPKYVGRKVSCFIENKFVKEATIVKLKNSYYLHQNVKNGKYNSELKQLNLKCGYLWCICNRNKINLEYSIINVSEVKLLNNENTYELWD